MKADREAYITYRGKKAFVMLNAFPYANGHLMVAPYRHVVNIEGLTPEESIEVFDLVKKSVRALKRSIRPHGFNIGINIGKAAGAGFKHFHIHIVPRWAGDTNFMPVLAEVKVLPEHLEKSYEKISRAFLQL